MRGVMRQKNRGQCYLGMGVASGTVALQGADTAVSGVMMCVQGVQRVAGKGDDKEEGKK